MGHWDSKPWLPYLLLPLAGLVVTSTGIHLIEDATGDVRPLNWTMFYVLNGPYIVCPHTGCALANRANEKDGNRVTRASPPRWHVDKHHRDPKCDGIADVWQLTLK